MMRKTFPALLGATFLGVQISEYAHLGFLPKDSAQASAFFSLTGLHGAHVFVGLIILCVVARRAFNAEVSSGASLSAAASAFTASGPSAGP